MIAVAELRALPLFAELGEAELEYLSRTVPDIHVAAGDYVANEGEGRALIVVVEGRCEVTKRFDGVEKVIAGRLPGTFFGEVPIILNSPFLASLRAAEPSRVIRIEPKVFHTLAASAPAIAAAVGAKAFERIGGLQDLAKKPTAAEVFLSGQQALPSMHSLRSFLHRNQIPFEWGPPAEPGDTSARVRLGNGTVLVDPSLQAIAKAVGLSIAPRHDAYDVVILGGGPAGMAAAVYGASEGLRTVLIEREAPGGQAGTSSRIENYLGFPNGVSGDELATRALQQARRLGAEIVVTRSVETIDVGERGVVLDGGDRLTAQALVLATGVTWRRLEIESLGRLTGRGVYYGAAPTEAALVQGRDVFLIGAGNSAGQAAVYFASHARRVTLVVRGESLDRSMSHYLVRQIASKPNVDVRLRSEVVAVHGDNHLEALDVVDRATGAKEHLEAAGLFVFIGADASTEWLPEEIAKDDRGYVKTGAEAARSGR